MKPLIYYVDDEPKNLTVLEANLSDKWEVKTFDNPMQALENLEKDLPNIIISDQRMPNCNGVKFLEMSQKFSPNSVRIIMTGYSDEDLIIDSVRKAKIYDYIRKPWDPDELEQALEKALEYNLLNLEKISLVEKLKKSEELLTNKNKELTESNERLEQSVKKEHELLSELKCWIPPFVLWSINQKDFKFPVTKHLVGIAIDIVNSSNIHNVTVMNETLRSLVLKIFSELIIKHSGWKESSSGDSAYGHFGLMDEDIADPFESALAVASEFRVSLRGLCNEYKTSVECGISLHYCQNCIVDVQKVSIGHPKGEITQKSFDTISPDIDLLHRMEKLAHQLPGSNIILSKQFLNNLKSKSDNIKHLGEYLFKGQQKPVDLYIIKSDFVKDEDLEKLKLSGSNAQT